jgi:hypothetical protein
MKYMISIGNTEMHDTTQETKYVRLVKGEKHYYEPRVSTMTLDEAPLSDWLDGSKSNTWTASLNDLYYSERPRKPPSFMRGMNGPTFRGWLG